MSEKPDLSNLFSMLASNSEVKNAIPEELLTTLMSSSSHSNSNINTVNASDNTSSSSNNIPDMEMVTKLMQVIKSSNQNSPGKDLLKSLKPFLNDSRKEKVDQYIKILGMTKALEMMNELGDKPK